MSVHVGQEALTGPERAPVEVAQVAGTVAMSGVEVSSTDWLTRRWQAEIAAGERERRAIHDATVGRNAPYDASVWGHYTTSHDMRP